MGNCLNQDTKVIKIITRDGEVLEYEAPRQVQHVLVDFSGHAICNSFEGSHHLLPETQLVAGRLYHLLPLPSTERAAQQRDTATTRKPDEYTDGDGENEDSDQGMIRLKLVVTKQQLADILARGIKIEDLISNIRTGTYVYNGIYSPNSRWKPTLRSIPEGCVDM